MRKKVEKILSEFVCDYGFCEFEKISSNLIQCVNIKKIPANAKTVITVIFPYCLEESKYENLNVSRYAAVPDYHTVANKYLEKIALKLSDNFENDEFVFFADNSPVNEVYAACVSGLGKLGRNGLLINEKYGSWVFIGEIVTTLDLNVKSGDVVRCENCNKCVEACPVNALSKENFDKDLCLSNVSQKKGDIPEEYQQLMKKYGCAWGCDICQKVCPHNKDVMRTSIEEFIEGFQSFVEENCEINGRAFAWRGEKVIKRNLKIINDKTEL